MEQDMTQGKPLSIILKFTLPLLVGNIFQQFYNMADTIIVGRFVGANALAAVGVMEQRMKKPSAPAWQTVSCSLFLSQSL